VTITVLVPSISAQAAHRAVGAALACAEAEKLAVVACVVDASGIVVAQLRMTGAPFHSNGVAHDKAYTAMSFRLPTDELGAQLSSNPILRDGIARRPGTILFGGGLPILENGQVIGGIGVSGASEDEDRLIAKAGLDAVSSDRTPSNY
jgi:uncharacterized protein GlcG (DUF336 family)